MYLFNEGESVKVLKTFPISSGEDANGVNNIKVIEMHYILRIYRIQHKLEPGIESLRGHWLVLVI